MSRDWRLYWAEVIKFCERIERYTTGIDRDAFRADEKTRDAVLRNLELIGEAVENLPPEARTFAPQIEWKLIAGLPEILAHRYFGLDDVILWDAISRDVPELHAAMRDVKLP